VGETDGAGEAELVLHAAGQPGQHHGGGRAVEAGGAGEVEEGLVEGERFDDGGERVHHRADRAGGFDVGVEAGLHDDGFGAELQGLEHRHGGFHALDAGDVAGGGDDAAAAAADDDGLVREGRVVAFLDGGEEGVAIHVGDGEGEEFGVPGQPRGPAGRAAVAVGEPGQAVAAEGLHGGSVAGPDGVGGGGVWGGVHMWTGS